MTLYEEAAAEFEAIAEDWRDSNARYAYCVETGADQWLWSDTADEQEYNRLMDLVHRLRGRAIEGPCLCVAAEDGSWQRCGLRAELGPDGYAVVQPDGAFVGAWRTREPAELIVNRSQAAKGERIVEITVHGAPGEQPTR